ncbi:MAG: hypothetical protein HOJ64_01545 [Euryarchaeota archaeon]|nr:hypothetical protein [Euryarchaeota archaeon]
MNGIKPGGSAESLELIKITNITPRLRIDFINLSEGDYSNFSMKEMKSNSRGEIEFRLQFSDNNNTQVNTTYNALMKVGRASVYFNWTVEVVIPELESKVEELPKNIDVKEIFDDEAEIEEIIIDEAPETVTQTKITKEEKKIQDLARVASNASSIDFETIGHTARSKIMSEYSPDNSKITLSDASQFPKSGNAYINDEDGDIFISWSDKNDNSLIGVIGMKRDFKQGALLINRDNLQEISGIGPFIEQKLNALGIFTFEQISKMDSEIEEQVNIAIEFFPGRVKRDEWARQAYEFNN